MLENPNQGSKSTVMQGSQAATPNGTHDVGQPSAPFFSQGFPATHFRDVSTPNGPPLVWFPRGLPPGRAVLVASSRIGTKLDELDDWFDALRTLAVRLNPETDFFVTAEGTTTDPHVRHVASRFGFSILEIKRWDSACTQMTEQVLIERGIVPLGIPVRMDSERTETELPLDLVRVDLLRVGIYQAFVLPISDPNSVNSVEQVRLAIENSNLDFNMDQLLTEIAADCFVLAIRPKGIVHHSVQSRLAECKLELGTNPGRTWVLVSPMTKPSIQSELEKAGAIGWWLYDLDKNELDRTSDDKPDIFKGSSLPYSKMIPPANRATVLELDEFPAERFLIHWTRYRIGPWPEQTQEQWLDDLLFQSDRRKHAAADALRRILATGQILASRKLTRDDQPVVCFSNRGLGELDRLTTYRQHLGRWDFVPFGVAIDRDWLHQQGARPVLYGDDETWNSLAEADRPFFQMARSKTGKVDWTIEREWRWLGNLNLRRIPAACVAAFVPNFGEAEAIAAICNWPIVVLDR